MTTSKSAINSNNENLVNRSSSSTETNNNYENNNNNNNNKSTDSGKEMDMQIYWSYVAGYAILHVGALYGIWLSLTQASWTTLIFTFIFYIVTGFGATAGVHRLWSHRAYKAKLPLRILLAYFNCTLYIGPIYEWCRDHRVHHKYTETHADPYNAKRGFFFSHIGWLMCKKHPDVIAAGKKIDMSDIESDSVCRFQRKYYMPLTILSCFIIPTFIPKLWGDSYWIGFWIPGLLRFVLQLHAGFLVNSIAHMPMYGRRPYDKNIYAAEIPLVSWYAGGEGFHNYHHTFPWDYGASELGWKWNPAKTFIDLMSAIGWAYDCKQVNPELIKSRKERTGDIKDCGPYGYY
ncbi:stearoyl-CoA desaturase 5-like [Panonychus citri]|uniref:stearoyl-CoA desaturase 5-like n=1 Tax=Panonychus citri TaxID=50023 RepID=UPI0023075B5E|nr:stearoyl-CoA desaturase 5-like [Panonychus citri]